MASVHFTTKSHFRLEPEYDARAEDWVTKAADKMATLFPARFDAFAIGGDLNNHKCIEKVEETDSLRRGDHPAGTSCTEEGWWNTFDARGYLDSVYDRHWQQDTGTRLVPQYLDGNEFRPKRIDFVFGNSPIEAASHDLTCGLPTNCRDFRNAMYYSDHRLVWALLKP